MAVAAAAVLTGSTWVLLSLLFVMGIEATFFGPLKYAILPDLLRMDELLLGNALVEAGTFLAILIGTIAGMLIATSHGAGAVSGVIVLVALGAWGASRAIPATAPAAPGARIRAQFHRRHLAAHRRRRGASGFVSARSSAYPGSGWSARPTSRNSRPTSATTSAPRKRW